MEGEAMTYCIVERRFALRFKRLLHRYAEDAGVTVIAEQRGSEQRAAPDRRKRALAVPPDIDRRTVLSPSGRRIADRRASMLPAVAPIPLPRRLRAHEQAVGFAERISLPAEQQEDVEAARLIVRIQVGELSQFEALYRRFFDRVYSFIATMVENDAAAEWLTQETFLELHDALPSYEVLPTGFREQLAAIMRAKAAEHLRRMHGIDLDEPVVTAEPARQEAPSIEALAFPDWITDVDLRLLIGRLPHTQRQTLLLRNLLGLSETEAARVCGFVPDAVFELHDCALGYLRGRLALLGRETAAPSMRLSMARGRRPGRVLRSRRFALTPS